MWTAWLGSSIGAGGQRGHLARERLLRHDVPLKPRHRQLQARCERAEGGEASFFQRRYGSFVRAPMRVEPPAPRPRPPCGRCSGTQLVQCHECCGTGRLPRGGYHKKNPPLNPARVVGSKWTAMERTFGWRHFRVTQKRREGKEAFVLMVSTCDESTQFWLNLKNLRERGRWAAGWLQKAEIKAAEELAGAACKACGGGGSVPCPLCSQAGQVVEL